MEVNRLQSNLLRWAGVILAVPVVFFTMGNEGIVKAGQQADLQKTREKKKEKSSSESTVRPLPRSIVEDLPNLLMSKESIYEMKYESQVPDLPERPTITFVATAYCIKNTTATGVMVRPGIIAADPSILPLGSIVKIRAGKYTGTYRVLDTGPAIRGRRLDIYMPCRSEAVTFGKRKVELEILRYGWGDRDEEVAVGE